MQGISDYTVNTPDSAGLQNMIVLLYDNQAEPPTQEFCQSYRQQYGVEIPLYFDAEHKMKIYGDHETNLILNESGRIVARIIGDSQQVYSTIEAELAAGVGECSTDFACPSEGNAERKCLPTPVGDAKVCTQFCKVSDSEPCPNDEVCHVYTAGNETGACFPADMIP